MSSAPPPTNQTLAIGEFIDGQKMSSPLITIILLGFAAQLGDGYDLAAVGFAAPGIVKDLAISREALAPVFSATLAGMLVGAMGFGWLGDRFGRRNAIVLGALFCSVFSFGCMFSTSLPMLAVMRFLTGIGLGGIPANTVALMAEYAPKRSRAMLITMMFMGITFGGMLPGLVTATLDDQGWQALFVVGGTIPLIAAVLNFAMMPESLKFLALRATDRSKLLHIVRRLRPDMAIADTVTFSFPRRAEGGFRVAQLFQADLRLMTPLVWVLFFGNLMANFFINSWLTTLLREAGLSPTTTALTNSLYYVGGVIGGLAISRSLDQARIAIVGVFMLSGALCVAALGQVSDIPGVLQVAVLLVGVTVLGVQLALNAVAGLTYPTAMRANGTGWALGIGRIGAILGPLIGGALIHMKLPLSQLLLAPSVPLFIGACAALALRPMAKTRWASDVDAAQASKT